MIKQTSSYLRAITLANFLLFFSFFSFGQTPIGGTFSMDTTLAKADSPFELTSDIIVNQGITMTIEAGVELQFENFSRNIIVEGTLIANGMDLDSIRFIGTNADPEIHGGSIYFAPTSTANQISIAVFEQLGDLDSGWKSGVYINSDSVTIKKCRFFDQEQYGLQNELGEPAFLQDNVFQNSGLNDIRADVKNVRWYENNVAENILLNGAIISDTVILPKAPMLGGAIYKLFGSIDVQSTGYLEIEAGAELQLPNTTTGFFVSGTLHALGTAVDSIYFNNGNSGNYGWGIFLEGGSEVNMTFCAIDSIGRNDGFPAPGNGAINLRSTNINIANSRITNGAEHGLIIESNSVPTVQNCKIHGFPSYGLFVFHGSPTIKENECFGNGIGIFSIHGNATPTLDGNSSFNNSNQQIYANLKTAEKCLNNMTPLIHLDGNVVDSITLPGNAILGGSIFQHGGMDVNPTATLILEPGLTFLGGNLNVHGELFAEGTVADSVKFKSNTPGGYGGRISFFQGSQGLLSVVSIDSLGGSNASIDILSSDVTIKNSTINNSKLDAIHVRENTNPLIENNKISNHGQAIWVLKGSPIIDGNWLSNGNRGITISEGIPTIKNNTISNNSSGLVFSGKGFHPIIEDNIFQNHTFWDVEIDILSLNGFHNNNATSVLLTGSVSSDVTLKNVPSANGSVFNIFNGMVVSSDATLTIEPGVTLKFPPIQQNGLIIFGTLNAQGTAADSIYFVNDTGQIPGDFGSGIRLNPSSKNNKMSFIRMDSVGKFTSLIVETSSLEFTNSLITNSQTNAIEIVNANPIFNHLEIRNNPGNAIQGNGAPIINNSILSNNAFALQFWSGAPVLSNCVIKQNANGINNIGTEIIDARSCWWGDPSGPFHPSLNPSGQGNSISDRVWFSPSIFSNSKQLYLDSIIADTFNSILPRFYFFEIPDSLDDKTISIEVSSDGIAGVNQIYTLSNAFPGNGSTQGVQINPTGLNPKVVIPELQPGTYYVSLEPSGINSQIVQVSLVLEDFALLSSNPSSGGNTGNVTLQLFGAQFDKNTTAFLKKGNTQLASTNISFINSTTIFATFNLNNVEPDTFDLIAMGNNGHLDTLETAFEIVTGELIPGWNTSANATGCKISDLDDQQVLQVSIENPAFGRSRIPVPIDIHYQNISSIDIPTPKRIFVSVDGNKMAFDLDNLPSGSSELLLEMKEEGGPPNILRPGAFGFIRIYARVTGGATGNLVNEFKLLK